MARHGTNTGKPLLSPESAEMVRRMRRGGAKVVDIARSMGLPYHVVHRASVGMTFNGAKRDHYRLSREDVVKLRELGGTMPAREIAKHFNITTTHVYAVINRLVWKDVA